VKLLVLGIAKLLSSGTPGEPVPTAVTSQGEGLGPPAYISPEQWGMTPRDGIPGVDGRADIYSLGVMLFELVAGRRPYNAVSVLDWRMRHLTSPVPYLHETLGGVPEAFSRTVARAMAKDRADRQVTTELLATELRASLG
jgi:serine/threonine-protein kinase